MNRVQPWTGFSHELSKQPVVFNCISILLQLLPSLEKNGVFWQIVRLLSQREPCKTSIGQSKYQPSRIRNWEQKVCVGKSLWAEQTNQSLEMLNRLFVIGSSETSWNGDCSSGKSNWESEISSRTFAIRSTKLLLDEKFEKRNLGKLSAESFGGYRSSP